ncbi:MAG: TauD/TfdA family dioxygenase [Burkholderiaceae bacterium]
MLTIQPRSGVGADVSGIDLRELDDVALERLRSAYADHGVLFFRDQVMTPADQITLARRFGEIDVNRFFRREAEHPEIAVVSKSADETTNIGGGWHTDHSYDVEPAMGSMLLARELPPRGGETLFSNMNAAFEALSAGLRRTLVSLDAVHSSRHIFGTQGLYARLGDSRMQNADQATQDAVHPVVIEHPQTGRPLLYVNQAFTLRFHGWSDDESRPLLELLYRHAARPEFQTRFEWAPGSIALWDNRATWHYALNNYPGGTRLMHRITIRGGPLKRWSH